jgi:hypothetical protein
VKTLVLQRRFWSNGSLTYADGCIPLKKTSLKYMLPHSDEIKVMWDASKINIRDLKQNKQFHTACYTNIFGQKSDVFFKTLRNKYLFKALTLLWMWPFRHSPTV